MSNVTPIKSVLIKIEPRMRKMNLELLQKGGRAVGPFVELDQVIIDSQKLCKQYMDKELRWVYLFLLIQVMVNVIIAWRLMK